MRIREGQIFFEEQESFAWGGQNGEFVPPVSNRGPNIFGPERGKIKMIKNENLWKAGGLFFLIENEWLPAWSRVHIGTSWLGHVSLIQEQNKNEDLWRQNWDNENLRIWEGHLSFEWAK